ncbi:MAG TPA: bifunctional diaminohydroxyphosphoribosylaminopyrimidine deaminase/5-amino-6-(5-phosphoribosylamino)uracil reductase RibD [Pseudomonadota bacterium]|nr:bifunctional diaminohydroxyphosphoribosylaminopyrimidine deaminase/5-amino-6-(5-phosphoribosylamino)uracil reductase RibD [Pseudomonadota bacterium]
MTVSTPHAGAAAFTERLLPGERSHDAAMMRLAIAAAETARGATSPNPLVGAVIVDESVSPPQVLATGFHAQAGRAHAEVDALQKLAQTGASATKKTLYVTLEPCNHVGRTGKCTDAILAAGLARVVIATADPNPHVAGGGAGRLREAGLEVLVGVCEPQCQWQNRGFLRWLKSGRPQLLLKAAISLDGRIAPQAPPDTVIGPRWLTGGPARQKAHQLRAASDAILVGAGTVLADDPQLTVRLFDREVVRQPLRVILDGALRVPTTAKALGPGSLLVTCESSFQAQPDRVAALQSIGTEVIPLPLPSSPDVASRRGAATDVDLHAVLRLLGQRQVLYALCEGGGVLHGALLESGLCDEAALFVAPLFLGDGGVPLLRHLAYPDVTAAAWIETPQYSQLGDDLFVTGALRRGGFAPSA